MAALELIMDKGVAHGMSKLVYVFVFDPHLLYSAICISPLSIGYIRSFRSRLLKIERLAAEMLLCATLQHVLEAVGN